MCTRRHWAGGGSTVEQYFGASIMCTIGPILTLGHMYPVSLTGANPPTDQDNFVQMYKMLIERLTVTDHLDGKTF